jgi:hypothetical protein
VLLPVAGRRCFTVHVGRPSNEGGSCGHHQAVQAAGEKESGLKLQVLRTDNGDEFTTAEFAAYCADEGSSATTPRRTCRNKMVWPNAETRLWWQPHAPYSSKGACRQSSGEKR